MLAHRSHHAAGKSSTETHIVDKASLSKYSLGDLRRLVYKLIESGVLEASLIEYYVQNELNVEVHKCDSTVEWTSYCIRNQNFCFPNFMQKPVYLARGGFSTVVKSFRYDKPVAVKKVEVPGSAHSGMALRLLRELEIMKHARKQGQRHICKILDVFGDPTVKQPEDLRHLYIVMPLYSPGALDSIVVTSPAVFKTIAGHTLSALRFLHLHNILHRDIKKANIFFDARKNRAYLADLGHARTWDSKRMSGNGSVGTRSYLSPEILLARHYDCRSDIYSLGQTWYEVMCMAGRDCIFPFDKSGGQIHIEMQWALDPTHNRLRTLEIPHAAWAIEKWAVLRAKAEEWQEDDVVHIIEAMLMFDPIKRADTSTLFKMPYFAPFVSANEVLDLDMVDNLEYVDVKRQLFELQHQLQGAGKAHI